MIRIILCLLLLLGTHVAAAAAAAALITPSTNNNNNNNHIKNQQQQTAAFLRIPPESQLETLERFQDWNNEVMLTSTNQQEGGRDRDNPADALLQQFTVTQSSFDDEVPSISNTNTITTSPTMTYDDVNVIRTNTNNNNNNSTTSTTITTTINRNLRLSHFAARICFPSNLPTSSAANIACRAGTLRINGTQVSGARYVQLGDIITYSNEKDRFDRRTNVPNDPIRAERFLAQRRKLVKNLSGESSHSPLRVLYEDECMAIVCKPSGIQTMSWSGSFGKSLCLDEILPLILRPPSMFISQTNNNTDDGMSMSVSMNMNENQATLTKIGIQIDNKSSNTYAANMDMDQSLPAPLPRHRLDNRVAGPVVVAKTRRASVEIGRAFEDKTAMKEYRAIVVGKVNFDTITNIIAVADTPTSFTIESEIEGCKSQTEVEILGTTPCSVHGTLTDLKLYPITGRRHQLRIHCAEVLGCPILGDDLHKGDLSLTGELDGPAESQSEGGSESDSEGGDKNTQAAPAVRRRKGLFLYCRKISIPHPKRSGEIISAEIPEPLRFTRTREKALEGYNWAAAHDTNENPWN